jgi:hypothetical protein
VMDIMEPMVLLVEQSLHTELDKKIRNAIIKLCPVDLLQIIL